MEWRPGVMTIPKGIIVISIFMTANSAIGIIFNITDISMLVASAIDVFVAYGLLKGKKWAGIASIVLAIVNIIFRAVGSALEGQIGLLVGIGLNIIILSYMLRPSTRRYFKNQVTSPSETWRKE